MLSLLAHAGDLAGGRSDLPIPEELFGIAAAAVLVISFIGLAILWPNPKLEDGGFKAFPRTISRVLLSAPSQILCGAVGVFLLGLVIWSGLTGVQVASANFAPTFVYVIFWLGLVPVSLLFGNVFRAFNPWRAIGRTFGFVAKRIGGEGLPEPLPYPERFGRWPAAAGLVAFAWLELVYSGREAPSTVATAALVYAAVQLLGMSVYGVEAWCRRGDAFGVYFNLLGRLGILDWRGRELWVRPVLSGAAGIVAVPGTVAVMIALIGTTSFDGFSQGPTWNSLAPDLQQLLVDLGISQELALQLAFTIGMAVVVALVAGLYRVGTVGMRSIDERHSAGELGARFAHSLLPIALAYVVAHYFSYLVVQGQAIGYLASDPLGDGANIFGTAAASIDYGFITANTVWYVQVGALIIGHVSGLILAHDRALTIYTNARDATRSQYWMLTVMVGFTCLGLWLLSAGAV